MSHITTRSLSDRIVNLNAFRRALATINQTHNNALEFIEGAERYIGWNGATHPCAHKVRIRDSARANLQRPEHELGLVAVPVTETDALGGFSLNSDLYGGALEHFTGKNHDLLFAEYTAESMIDKAAQEGAPATMQRLPNNEIEIRIRPGAGLGAAAAGSMQL